MVLQVYTDKFLSYNYTIMSDGIIKSTGINIKKLTLIVAIGIAATACMYQCKRRKQMCSSVDIYPLFP